MTPQEIIAKKRDGERLSDDEISFVVSGLVDGGMSDGQAAAFAMAVYFRDMDRGECAALATHMANSGMRLAWRADLPGPVVDKHSTGGVGDLVSLLLAPMAAACGAFVPMIAGRGLGHTGGTIDKLEAIPGYCAAPDAERFRRTVEAVGCAIVGQTEALAPADRRLYAIRDVTGTVESIPLIVASILSKKLAAGLDALVMDVKCGSGAFMRSEEEARSLGGRLAEAARGAGLPTSCLITDMRQPLAPAAGNALEVDYAIGLLTRTRRDSRVETICVELVAEMLALSGLCPDRVDGRRKAEEALGSGAAAERFARMIVSLGGPGDVLERPDAHLRRAPIVVDAEASSSGFVRAIDVRRLGLAVVALGGGRTAPGRAIDASVGLTQLAGLGAHRARGEPLGRVFAASREAAEAAARAVVSAYDLGAEAEPETPLILGRIAPAAESRPRV